MMQGDNQCDQSVFQNGPFSTMKICFYRKNDAKVGLELWLIKFTLKNCQRLLTFCQSGKISSFKCCQSRFKTMPKIKFTLKNCQKTFDILPKWRNFSKSGHTGGNRSSCQTNIDITMHVKGWWSILLSFQSAHSGVNLIHRNWKQSICFTLIGYWKSRD